MFAASLGDWWTALNSVERIYWGMAIVFSVLFAIQFILSLFGMDSDHDFHLDHDTDTGFHGDASFTVLSVRSFIAFFTFFSWTGVLVLSKGGSILSALLLGGFMGLLAMFLVGYVIYFFMRMQESGNLDINTALYAVGDVYLTIPSNKMGFGKIHLKIGGSLRELDAVTEGKSIPTGSTVRVVEVLNDNLLLVEPVDKLLLESLG